MNGIDFVSKEPQIIMPEDQHRKKKSNALINHPRKKSEPIQYKPMSSKVKPKINTPSKTSKPTSTADYSQMADPEDEDSLSDEAKELKLAMQMSIDADNDDTNVNENEMDVDEDGAHKELTEAERLEVKQQLADVGLSEEDMDLIEQIRASKGTTVSLVLLFIDILEHI